MQRERPLESFSKLRCSTQVPRFWPAGSLVSTLKQKKLGLLVQRPSGWISVSSNMFTSISVNMSCFMCEMQIRLHPNIMKL